MLYCTDGFLLNPICEVFCGPVNDVLIARNLASPTGSCYTLWVVKESGCVGLLLQIFENTGRNRQAGEQPYLFRFTQNGLMIFGFQYLPERKLSTFGAGQLRTDFSRECACINLVMACLSSPMPYPLLCQLLAQDSIGLQKDNSVFFTYCLDLSKLNEADDEATCANQCAAATLRVFGGASKLKSNRLMQKKLEKAAYRELTELYRDIKLTAVPKAKRRLSERLSGFWQRNRDGLFRALLVVSSVVILVTLVVLISQLIWGDIPLLRIFEHTFDVIGTETLR